MTLLNSTQVPNALLEAIINDEFTEREIKVLLFITRKTIGWHKETQWVTLDYLEKCLPKLWKTHASSVLSSLEKKGAITRTPHKDGGWEVNLAEKWGVTKSVTDRYQIGNHSIMKRNNYTSDGADAPRLVSDKEWEDRNSVPKDDSRRVKDKLAIYHLFSPSELPWWKRRQEREAALSLFDYGVEKVRRGLDLMRENKDDKYCPQAYTPCQYVEKLPKLKEYLRRKDL